MKLSFQILIIFSICYISSCISKILPIPLPASIISMFILFFMLLAGVIKTKHIKEFCNFLTKNMAFFFIPAGVEIMERYDLLAGNILTILLICVLTLIVTFFVTLYSVIFIKKFMDRKTKNAN